MKQLALLALIVAACLAGAQHLIIAPARRAATLAAIGRLELRMELSPGAELAAADVDGMRQEIASRLADRGISVQASAPTALIVTAHSLNESGRRVLCLDGRLERAGRVDWQRTMPLFGNPSLRDDADELVKAFLADEHVAWPHRANPRQLTDQP